MSWSIASMGKLKFNNTLFCKVHIHPFPTAIVKLSQNTGNALYCYIKNDTPEGKTRFSPYGNQKAKPVPPYGNQKAKPVPPYGNQKAKPVPPYGNQKAKLRKKLCHKRQPKRQRSPPFYKGLFRLISRGHARQYTFLNLTGTASD